MANQFHNAHDWYKQTTS